MKWKRAAAWVLTAAMVMGSIPEYTVNAAERTRTETLDQNKDQAEGETGSQTESELQSESQGNAEKESETQTEAATEPESQTESETVFTEEQEEETETETVDTAETETEGASEQTGETDSVGKTDAGWQYVSPGASDASPGQIVWKPELNFVYMEPMKEEGKQMVIVSMELNDRILSEAALTYLAEDGTEKLILADEILAGYAVFLPEEIPAGEEGLKTLELKADDGEAYQMNLEDFREKKDTETLEMDLEEQDKETVPAKTSRKALLYADAEAEEVVVSDADEISNALSAAEDQMKDTARLSRSGTTDNTGSGSQDVIVVLDPGHGGSDGGATRTWGGITYMEKDINLKISKYTKAELETYEGIKVYMTRNSDVAVGLEERVAYAANLGASAVISQHINSTSQNQGTATGSLVFVASGNYRKEIAQQGWDLAGIILEELSKLGLKNNGTYKNLSETGNKYPNGKLADYYAIVRYGILYKVPGIIVEHAFVNNPSDCKNYFKYESSLKKLGVADATAIARYYGLKKKDGSSTEIPQQYGWVQEGGNWYYLKSDGTRMKGFNIVDGEVYYFNSKGYRVTGWQNLEVSRYYFQSNGVMSKYLTKVGKKYYYFNDKGWLMKGFFSGKGKKRYYANSKGVLQTGWKKYKNKWYYFDPQTYEAATGLQKIDGKWYYFGPKGVMKTGWQQVGEESYYFNADGSAKKGWISSGNKWYYLNKSGKMVKGKWVKSKKKYYYLNKKGIMLSNRSKKIKGKKYNFSLSGACLNKK